MKHRNALFVAGFPYAMFLVAYTVLIGVSMTSPQESADLTPTKFAAMMGGFGILLIGSIYSYYWLISTAGELKRHFNADIPAAILALIPIANLWWEWKYAQAVEPATKGKIQAVLAFILLVLLGSIGMGILQDSYNKLPTAHGPTAHEPRQDNPVQ